MDFLVKHFTILGVDVQYWMPILIAACAIYIFYLWKTGQLR
jgi:hypothetical protein